MLENLITLFFPRCCLTCNQSLHQEEEYLCSKCHLDLPLVQEFTKENSLWQRFAPRLDLAHVSAYLRYQKKGMTQKLLYSLKYQGHSDLGQMLGRWQGQKLKSDGLGKSIDLIVPIPLHPTRKRQRGYNQSACLAEGIAEILEVEWSDDYLIRQSATQTQTRKTKEARWENVEQIFKIIAPDKIKNKRLLLVDDVVTTGATLENCAITLMEGGCQELSIAALATADA